MDEVVDAEAIPDVLTKRDQWLHWDSSNDTPRRPHKAGNFRVAWSDPDNWMSYTAATSQTVTNSWGIGYVCAAENPDHPMGVVTVLDLDGAADDDDRPKDWVPSLSPFFDHDCYVEWSPSHQEDGDSGIHIPVTGSPPDWWSDTHRDDHEGVDVLANKFCTFTGDVVEGAGQEIPSWSDDWVEVWLMDAYENLTGDTAPPRDEKAGSGATTPTSSTAETDFDDDFPDAETAEEMLDHINPDCEYEKWRNIGFALADHFPKTKAKRLFDMWSRGGSKYDDDAAALIDDISSRGSGGITIATLVHHAKQAGWEPEFDTSDPEPPTPEELLARASDEFDSVEDVPDDVFEVEDTDDDETEETADTDESEGSDEDDEDPASWAEIYEMYRSAEDADERLVPRHEATNKLLDDSCWRGILENDTLWKYNDEKGIYEANGEARIRKILSQRLNEQFKVHECNEITEQVKGRRTIPEEELGGPNWKICTENCVLELDSSDITVVDHNPEYEFIGRVSTPYDPEAECPTFMEFLKDVVPETPERQKLQEFAGYTLMHWEIPFHKALFLVGPTASGKSTFLDSIRTMLGNDAVSSVTPQQMTSERFSGSELYGAWANIRNDIPATIIENTGEFKEIVGGDPIKVEEKYQQPFMHEPTAKHMFSANELPDTNTDDNAFYRRILLVPFPHTVPRGERDPRLDEKIQAEHPGILNWALEGLQRLLNNGRFTHDRSPGQTQETWAKWSSSVERFHKHCLESGGDGYIPTGELFRVYLAYCDEEGIPAETEQQLVTKKLKSFGGYQTGREYIDGTRERVLHGVEYTSRGADLKDHEPDDDSSASGVGVTDF